MEKKQQQQQRGLNGPETPSARTSTTSLNLPPNTEPARAPWQSSNGRNNSVPNSMVEEKPAPALNTKKSLPPLSLPPISLGPLTIPNVSKASYFGQGHGDASGRNMSPPLSRQTPKTPTTPMTASRSTFFSKSKYDDTIEFPALRSSSSVMHLPHRATPSPPADASSTDSSLALQEAKQKPAISPFLSSSVPKGGLDHGFLHRPNGDAHDQQTAAPAAEERALPKPAGPRPPKTNSAVPESPAPKEKGPDPADTPATPSSMSNLRRKLSLTWKRKDSKSGMAGSDVGDKSSSASQSTPQASQPAMPMRQDSMPPPRIPVSATMSNLSTTSSKQASPSPALRTSGNGGYLETRRRKSSGASLGTFVSHDRTKSDGWGIKKTSDPVDSSAMPPPRNPSVMQKILKPKSSASSFRRGAENWTAELDKDDLAAEEEMRKMGSRRKETEIAAKTIDALRKRASPKERVGPHEAIRIAMLNIYERGEIIDYNDVFFCGTQNANKVVGDLHSSAPNFGYDDERGDYTIVPGDHLAFRYEVVDVLGKGSFGQVVRCIDHKLGVLVAVKIIRNKKRFHQQALVEVNILQKLREWVRMLSDPRSTHFTNKVFRIQRIGIAW